MGRPPSLGISRRGLIAAAGCALSGPAWAEATGQGARVQDVCVSLADRGRAPPPFTAVFRRGGESLWFLAARHTTDPASPTFQEIERRLWPQAVRAVVVERHISPDASLFRRLAQTERRWGNEAGYASALAGRRGVPVLGGEPSDEQLVRELRARGHELEDIVGAYTLRSLRGALSRSPMSGGALEQTAESMGVRYARRLSAGASTFSFRAWYLSEFGVAPAEDPVLASRGVPCGVGSSAVIVTAMTNLRNAHLGRVLGGALDSYEQVMVVYGEGHYWPLAPWLSQRLGPPAVQALGA